MSAIRAIPAIFIVRTALRLHGKAGSLGILRLLTKF
jgi:hypothetical protein